MARIPPIRKAPPRPPVPPPMVSDVIATGRQFAMKRPLLAAILVGAMLFSGVGILVLADFGRNARCYRCGHEFYLWGHDENFMVQTSRQATCPKCDNTGYLQWYFASYNRAH